MFFFCAKSSDAFSRFAICTIFSFSYKKTYIQISYILHIMEKWSRINLLNAKIYCILIRSERLRDVFLQWPLIYTVLFITLRLVEPFIQIQEFLFEFLCNETSIYGCPARSTFLLSISNCSYFAIDKFESSLQI